MNEKYLKYLPSKKFIIILSVALVAVIIFASFYFYSKKGIFFSQGTKDNTALAIDNQTINDLLENDTDGDKVPDWEEALWGTDKNNKNTFEMPDATYIENKKMELSGGQSVDNDSLTETDKFAREFFSSFTAMQASGQVDTNTINGFSNALGQKIVNPTLIDNYSETNLKIDVSESANDPSQKQKYYATVQRLFQTYQKDGIGEELDIINTGLASGTTNTPDSYSRLPIIADAYTGFAKDIMGLRVPSELAMYHLQIANSASNTGIAVKNMTEIIRDPLVGLQGISQYQKYSEDLVNGVADLETALMQ